MSFADIAILWGLLGGCIYATISVTLKILDYPQKKSNRPSKPRLAAPPPSMREYSQQENTH